MYKSDLMDHYYLKKEMKKIQKLGLPKHLKLIMQTLHIKFQPLLKKETILYHIALQEYKSNIE